MRHALGLLLPLGLIVTSTLAADPPAKVSNVTLPDTSGRPVAILGFKDCTVVVFLGTECPLVNQYIIRLKELHAEFAGKSVQFVAINSNSQDSAERVAAHAKEHGLPFPVLKDADHKSADQFGAQRTPEAFVLDTKGTIVYRGRIDDQYGIGFQRPKANRRDLAEALNEVLAGKRVSVARTEAAGCFIGRDKAEKTDANVTYAKHVAPILQRHCQECHRAGQIGPFSLLTYRQAKSWSDTIAEVVKDRRMPPWHADPKHGVFKNDRSLPAEDRETLLAWIEQGCPRGDDKDLPPPRSFVGAEGWTIGKPDVVLTMPDEFKVPATALLGWGVPYQYFEVPTNFTEDVWVQAAEARPGNRAVVHHILVYVLESGKPFGRGPDRIGNNFLVGTAPGDMPTILRLGMAKKIPKGAKLLFQMHYTPNGIEQTDRSSVGLIFAKEPPTQIVRTRTVMQPRFVIPAGAANHKVVSTSTFDKETVLLSFMPHMHLRGKSFEYKAIYPDGKETVLLSVPRYDFGWQSTYRLKDPLRLPAGTRIECTAHFDNSENNPNNPDPTKEVRWGDQTWQEMMIGWLDYYTVDEKPAAH